MCFFTPNIYIYIYVYKIAITHSIIQNGLKQACCWEYCKDIKKHYYTEKLGWPEPNPLATLIKVFYDSF